MRGAGDGKSDQHPLTPATRAYHEIWLTDENGEKEK
ncbi:MAG: hypothetical protein CM1200mP29_09940 [Verrucomicrobiota bacterium]|nr:MAG: hypothetical protein CM1200mP29_09940 [Verrucomicrobiota bacterium]